MSLNVLFKNTKIIFALKYVSFAMLWEIQLKIDITFYHIKNDELFYHEYKIFYLLIYYILLLNSKLTIKHINTAIHSKHINTAQQNAFLFYLFFFFFVNNCFYAQIFRNF